MKKMKRASALVLTLVMMLALLSACGGGGSQGGSSGGNKEPEATATPEYVYTAEFKQIDDYDSGIYSGCISDGRIYFAGQLADGEVTDRYATGGYDEDGKPIMEEYSYTNWRSTLMSVKLDGTDMQELPEYVLPTLPEGYEDGGANISSMSPDGNGGFYVLESLYGTRFDLPEDFDPEYDDKWSFDYESFDEYLLRHISATGAEIDRIDLSSLSEGTEYFWVNDFCIDKAGTVYIMGPDNTIFICDGTGKLLGKLEGGENSYYNYLVTTNTGDVGVSMYSYSGDSGGQRFCVIDPADHSLGDEYVIPSSANTVYDGTGDYMFYYVSGISLYGYVEATSEAEKLVNWLSVDVNPDNLNVVLPAPDGSIVCATSEWKQKEETTVAQLVTLTKVPASSVPAKTTLTYACMWLDSDIRAKIIAFNKSSDKYRIEVQDYSEYNTEDDYTAGVTKLNTEIISGKVPDILGGSEFNLGLYAGKGLLEDLYPYLDADTALGGRAAIVPSLLKAMERDGKLYSVTPGFSINTAYGLSAVVGDAPSWSFEDLRAAYAKLNPGALYFTEGTTRESMLNQAYYMNSGSLVDWATGQCHFDSQTFIDILTLASAMPEKFDWDSYDYETDYVPDITRLNAGDQLLINSTLSSFDDLVYMIGPDLSKYSFVGYPTADGSSGSSFSISTQLAMSSKCADKDGAWQFIRLFLAEDYGDNTYMYQFPANANALEAQFADALVEETDEYGVVTKWWYWNESDPDGETQEITHLDQAFVDKVRELINNTSSLGGYDESIIEILADECTYFFNGQKTAEATAQSIQDRVSIYVNEQK